ncbi:hypothetical protein [Nocardia asteroides]|nr:hypothetical protein [Nocardia asteroides]UGT47568.1 hypothetical protein LT345_24170 [Nocardia asteroides]SFM48809.1 hypothetical protein SAMN05444423_103135 [Nocardia asteroides]VEG33522.1 Uncharacterised protein [Nocardia asteroides]
MASTSLPLAAAAAVATLLAAPAGAVPSDQPTTPATPAPAQPGTEQPSGETPETGTPEQTQPETPENVKPGENKSGETTPAQPGVTTPAPGQPGQSTPVKPTPSQPGVTTPRVAPLPVPGQGSQAQPAVHPGQQGTTPRQETTPGQEGTSPGQQGTTPGQPGQQSQGQPAQTQPAVPSEQGAGTEEEGSDKLVETPTWQAPHFDDAPAAPVVEMEGPHQEIGVSVDGGGVLPGVVNTHHYNNASGYVGTVGYRTPTGYGDAGVSVEYIGENSVKVTTYNGGDGRADNTTVTVLDTTQANLAKAAVENWIKAQPGGTAALEAAAKATLPVPGELLQTVNVAGVTTQWGGSLQY